MNVTTGTRGFLTSKSTTCRFFLRNHLHWSISETPGPSFYRRPQAFHWRQKICRVLDRAGLWSYPVKKGVSNEKVGVSDEKFWSPIKRLGSSMKSFGLRFRGLRWNVHMGDSNDYSFFPKSFLSEIFTNLGEICYLMNCQSGKQWRLDFFRCLKT